MPRLVRRYRPGQPANRQRSESRARHAARKLARLRLKTDKARVAVGRVSRRTPAATPLRGTKPPSLIAPGDGGRMVPVERKDDRTREYLRGFRATRAFRASAWHGAHDIPAWMREPREG